MAQRPNLEQGLTMDWSRLPADILDCIAGRFPDPVDIIRMRVVCKGWGSASPSSAGATVPHFVPWIMNRIIRLIDDDEFLTFYSPSSKKNYRFQLPDELLGMKPVSTDGGFVLFSNKSKEPVALLNPLTGKMIKLPPCGYNISALFLSMPDFSWKSHNTMILCMNDSEIVVYRNSNIAHGKLSNNRCLKEVVHYNGKLYFNKVQPDDVIVFDIETMRQQFTIALPPITPDTQCRLVASASHGLLLVVAEKLSVEVFQLNLTSYPPQWVKITSLINHALLIGKKNGFSLEISSNNSAEFEGDYIYELRRPIRKFSAETGQKIEELMHPFMTADWFLPNPRF